MKAATEVYAPASGEVTAANEALTDEPGKINADALGDGWMFKIALSDASELDALFDQAGYKAYLETLD